MRTIGASQDDMNILIMRKFIIPFDNGIVVIKHWRIHNYIQRDRYHPTKYEEEKAQLSLQDNGTYSVQIEPMDTTCIQDVSRMDTEVRLGKDRLGKDRLELEDCKGEEKSSPPRTKRFVKPTLEDIKAYCQERKNSVNAERFFDYYESNGWKVGKNPMKDWKAAVRTWERKEQPKKESRYNDSIANRVKNVDNW